MSISTVVFLKFLIVWGFIFWYTRRQSRQMKASIAELRAREAGKQGDKADSATSHG
jgi:hypothetical protein